MLSRYHTKSLQREFSLDRLVRSVVRETETDASLASAEEVVLTAYYYTVRHRRYRTVTDADQQGRDELFDLSEHGLALLSRFPAPTGRMALICGTVWRAEGYISQFVGAYEEAVQRSVHHAWTFCVPVGVACLLPLCRRVHAFA